MPQSTAYDHPDRPPAADERTKIVFTNFDRSRNEFMDVKQRDKFKAFMKAYRAYFETEDDGSVSNLAVPLIAAHVDSFYSRLIGMRPVIEIWPREPGDEARARKQRLLVDYQWDRMRMLLHGAMLAKAGLIYGIGWGKCTWRKEVRKRLVKRSIQAPAEVLGINLGPFEGLLGGLSGFLTTSSMNDVSVWNDPWFENIPPDQVYPDPDGTDIDSCRYLIHRTVMTLDELEALIKGAGIKVNRAAVGRLKDHLKGGSLLDDGIGVTVGQEAADTFGGTGSSGLTEDPTKREFTLLEHWTDERVRWAVSGNPDIGLIRDEPHALGMKPFVRYTPDPLPYELMGTALTERLFSINLEMNALKNARMDNVLRTAYPQVMIPRGSLTNPAHIRFQAGGYFFADPQNPPDIFQYPEMKLALYREMADLKQTAEEVGGTRTFRGLAADGDTTATEASLLAQASGTKFGAMLQQMNEQPYKRLGRLMVRLNELNVDEERAVRIMGPSQQDVGFDRVTPEDLAAAGDAELDVTIDVATKDPDTRIVKMRRAVEIFQALAQAAQFDPALVPMAREVAKVMARMTDEVGDPDALLKQGEQMLAAQQQQQQQAQQQQAGGGFFGPQNALTEGGQLAADNGASGLPS